LNKNRQDGYAAGANARREVQAAAESEDFVAGRDKCLVRERRERTAAASRSSTGIVFAQAKHASVTLRP
jgi:hypothetical protein